jgi:hypothetical protein
MPYPSFLPTPVPACPLPSLRARASRVGKCSKGRENGALA